MPSTGLKDIFNPGETVSFTISFVDSVAPVLLNVANPHVLVTDPNGATSSYTLTNTAQFNLYQTSFTLSTSPVFGQWTFTYYATVSNVTNTYGTGYFVVVPQVPGAAGAALYGKLSQHALSTVPATKIALGLDLSNPTEDDWILQQINAWSRRFESETMRHFELEEFVNEPYAGSGRQYLVLKNRPLVTVTNINIVAIPVTDWLPPTREEAEGGLVFRQYGWFPGFLGIRQGLDIGDPHPTYIFKNISVTYTAGYVLPKDDSVYAGRTLPEDIEMALWNEISRSYTKRLSHGFKKQKTPVGEEIEFFEDELLESTKQLLLAYRDVAHSHGEVL